MRIFIWLCISAKEKQNGWNETDNDSSCLWFHVVAVTTLFENWMLHIWFIFEALSLRRSLSQQGAPWIVTSSEQRQHVDMNNHSRSHLHMRSVEDPPMPTCVSLEECLRRSHTDAGRRWKLHSEGRVAPGSFWPDLLLSIT